MSNVVTSQPRQEANINSRELPSSETNCNRCCEDISQCCLFYFTYCNKCHCSGCCDEERQKTPIPQRRKMNYFSSDRRPQRHEVNYYSDYDIIRISLHGDNDHRQNYVPEYAGTADNVMGYYEGGDNFCDRGNFGSGQCSELFELGNRSSDNNRHYVSGGHTRGGGDSCADCWGSYSSGDYSGSSNGGGDSGGSNGGDNGGSNGGGDSGGDYGGGDSGGDYGGGDSGGDYGGGDTGGDYGGGGDD